MSKKSENKLNTGLSNNDKDPVCNNYDLNAVTFGKNAFKKIKDKVKMTTEYYDILKYLNKKVINKI